MFAAYKFEITEIMHRTIEQVIS